MGYLPVVSIPPVAIAPSRGTRRRLDLLSVGRRHPIPFAPTQWCGRLRGGGATLSGRAWVSLPAPVPGPPGPGASKLTPNPRAQTRAGAGRVQGAAPPWWRLPPAKRPSAHTPASPPRAVRKSPARKLAPANRSQAAKAAPSLARLTRALSGSGYEETPAVLR